MTTENEPPQDDNPFADPVQDQQPEAQADPAPEAQEPEATEPEAHPAASKSAAIIEVNKKMKFIGGRFLDSEAFPVEGVVVTFRKVTREMVKDHKTGNEKEFAVVQFDELDMPMLLSAKIHRKQVLKFLGNSAKNWIGKTIRIYKDTSKTYGPDKHFSMRFKKS